MAEFQDNIEESIEEVKETAEKTRRDMMEDIFKDPNVLLVHVLHISQNWADFHITVVSPFIEPIHPPIIHQPEKLEETEEVEHVYAIHDYGYKLSASKSEDMFSSGLSMAKLHNTIEKMIYLLVERLKTGGVGDETEVQVAFFGHESAKRKAFESIINLTLNVVVTNFDPGEWGESYLERIKIMADKGYGYPKESPRDTFRHSPGKGGSQGPQ